MKRYQKYVRYSGLRPHDFEDIGPEAPTLTGVFAWLAGGLVFGYFVSYFL